MKGYYCLCRAILLQWFCQHARAPVNRSVYKQVIFSQQRHPAVFGAAYVDGDDDRFEKGEVFLKYEISEVL